MIRYYPEHGFLGDAIIGFLSNFIDSAQVKIFRKDLNLMKNSNRKYTYFILAKSQYEIKSVIKKTLENNIEHYTNVTFIYVGVKNYSKEIEAYVKKAGMSYKFLDINSI